MEDAIPAETAAFLNNSQNAATMADNYMFSTETPYWKYPEYRVSQLLWDVYPPFVLLFGVFGNVMIIVIMRRMKSGDSSMNIYFTAVAVLDLTNLCVHTLGQWLRYMFQFRLDATHDVVCKLYTWFFTGGGTMSAWCLVCMTVHRAMSVVWPHRVNLLCTRRTVLLVVTGIVIFFAILYSHYMIGFKVVESGGYWCKQDNDNESYIYFAEHIFAYIELTVYCLLPFVTLLVSNSVLIWKLTQSIKAAGKFLAQGNAEQVQTREKAANSVTLTVLAVSVSFIVLTLPASLSYVLFFFQMTVYGVSGRRRAELYLVDAVCLLLSHTNTAVNFYLYCLTGRRFREEFLKVMRCLRMGRLREANQ